ncbi:predicted protein [Verticillium alfalfae VaMs.102]|uniref:Predicted protein n=1 Tax=Verticillium alfalfae (strain VaMs.102 / ATCC MYA-4576 / FGSC 10136) TaxID=526221 RepID=C9SKL4_VERA1|nr:predicted protein [Verticillium alfalfae VaMs.102]EEY19232.1 predicted protein [Verticillium alfalfae VaMs.102]
MVSMIRAPKFDASLPPRIVVSPIIPSSSLVFKLVRKGRLGQLKSLLASGQASVRSQDEDGRTLLHLSRETARDVVYANAKLLLEAGADPFLVQDSSMSPVRMAIRSGRSDILSNMATNWGYFPTDQAETDGRGLLEFAFSFNSLPIGNWVEQQCCPHIDIEMLAPILDMGVSVHDSYPFRLGGSCLHLAVQYVAFWGSNVERDAIIYLVRQGADVRAKSDAGFSVTDIANVSTRTRMAGSYTRDLWDVVLVACGYDPHAFPRNHPYRPRWRTGWRLDPKECYGMSDLQRLWKGMEDRCPYSFCSGCPSSGIDYDHELQHILQEKKSPWVGERQKALAKSRHRRESSVKLYFTETPSRPSTGSAGNENIGRGSEYV